MDTKYRVAFFKRGKWIPLGERFDSKESAAASTVCLPISVPVRVEKSTCTWAPVLLDEWSK